MKNAALAGIALASLLLAGCTGDTLGRAMVPAGGYDLYDCKQLASTEAKQRERAGELEKLMVRARQGPGGGLISSMTYEPEYEGARTKAADLRKVMTERNCPTSTPAVENAIR